VDQVTDTDEALHIFVLHHRNAADAVFKQSVHHLAKFRGGLHCNHRPGMTSLACMFDFFEARPAKKMMRRSRD